MHEPSTFRLYLLRGTYLIMVVGLGTDIWPGLLFHTKPWDLWRGVGESLLATVALLALLGLRYPLKLLPLLFFEMVWKTIWLVVIALPLWRAGQVDQGTHETIVACLMGVIFPVVMPWRYVFDQYVKAKGDRWTPQRPEGGPIRYTDQFVKAGD
jgi:hypothetical protein